VSDSLSEMEFSITVPGGWYQLPAPDDAVDEHWAETVAGLGVDDEVGQRLLFGLRNVTAVARAKAGSQRAGWALIAEPTRGRVDALMTLNVMPQRNGDFDRYLEFATAEQEPDAPIEVINRTVSRAELAAGPAVVVHDFTLVRNEGGVAEPALERATIGVFPVDGALAFELAIVTQDLAVFEDVAALATEIAAEMIFEETSA
jgi:hypothetical protein